MNRPEWTKKHTTGLGVIAAILVLVATGIAFVRFGAHQSSMKHSPDAVANSEWFQAKFGKVTYVASPEERKAGQAPAAHSGASSATVRSTSEQRVRALFPEVR